MLTISDPSFELSPGSMANSPDFMIVEGLSRHAHPVPQARSATNYRGDQQISYKLTIGEVQMKYTDDLKMPAAHERAANKYQGAPNKLAEKLRDAGCWKVTSE